MMEDFGIVVVQKAMVNSGAVVGDIVKEQHYLLGTVGDFGSMDIVN